jgi:hypothetical protein
VLLTKTSYHQTPLCLEKSFESKIRLISVLQNSLLLSFCYYLRMLNSKHLQTQRLRTSGMCRLVAWKTGTNIPKENAASIFSPEDGGNYYQTTCNQMSEDCSLNIHFPENVTSRLICCYPRILVHVNIFICTELYSIEIGPLSLFRSERKISLTFHFLCF